MGNSEVILGLWGLASVTAVAGWNVAKYVIARAEHSVSLATPPTRVDAT